VVGGFTDKPLSDICFNDGKRFCFVLREIASGKNGRPLSGLEARKRAQAVLNEWGYARSSVFRCVSPKSFIELFRCRDQALCAAAQRVANLCGAAACNISDAILAGGQPFSRRAESILTEAEKQMPRGMAIWEPELRLQVRVGL
jgi:hypothetical protein